MKISKPRLLGRYKDQSGKAVNIYTGRNMQRGTDHYFYYRSGTKVFITCSDFHGQWSKDELTEEQRYRRNIAELSKMDKKDLVDLVLYLNGKVEKAKKDLDQARQAGSVCHSQLMQGMTSRGGVTVPRGFNG